MTPIRSHVSVRSYYFRELIADNSDAAIAEFTLADYRIFWRWANNKARNWRRQATNRWNDQTKRWEQGVWQNANGSWSHHKDAKREWSDKVGCETDLRFAKQWD